MTTQARTKIRFDSGGEECVAFHYAGTNGACVVMAPGSGVTKEPGTDLFASAFHGAGFSVLAFDFRRFGESGGSPRQVIRVKGQLEDFETALRQAARLPEVDPARIALWGFSLAGGHVMRVAAARELPVAAVIAQSPYVDGLVSAPNALRHETVGVILRFPFIALQDLVQGAAGREPRLVPLAGPRGTVAMLTTPDAQDGDRALNPGDRYPEWIQAVAARSVLPLGSYRPGRSAGQVQCPMLVVSCTEDQSVLPGPAIKAAHAAPKGELLEVPGGHYAPFLEEHQTVAEAEIEFLNRNLLWAEGGHAQRT